MESCRERRQPRHRWRQQEHGAVLPLMNRRCHRNPRSLAGVLARARCAAAGASTAVRNPSRPRRRPVSLPPESTSAAAAAREKRRKEKKARKGKVQASSCDGTSVMLGGKVDGESVLGKGHSEAKGARR
ncbi:hypothetical protein MRX96_011706 [Rhipicephalus microplus]